MAHWKTRYVTLLMWHLLLFVDSGVVAVTSFATPSGFEDFGNFGGFRGFHQFHGWLSNALDDNSGSQTQGFPAGYLHPDSEDDSLRRTIPELPDETDSKRYPEIPKINNPKNAKKLPEVKPKKHSAHKLGSAFSTSEDSLYEVKEPAGPQEQLKYVAPATQRVSEAEKESENLGSISDGVYESLKLKRPKSGTHHATEDGDDLTKNHYLEGGVYGAYEPLSHTPKQTKPSTPKRVSVEEKQNYGSSTNSHDLDVYKTKKPHKKQKKTPKYSKQRAQTAKKHQQGSSPPHVGITGGFQPIPPPRLELPQYGNVKPRANLNGNNLVYFYPSPYHQTLSAIQPSYRGVVKLQNPVEHRRNYLAYKSMLSKQVY